MRLNSCTINSAVLGAFVFSTGLLYSEDSIASSHTEDSALVAEARLQGDVSKATSYVTESKLVLNSVRLRDYGANWVYSGAVTAPTIYQNGNFTVAGNIFSGQARLIGGTVQANTNSTGKINAIASLRSTVELISIGGLNTYRLNEVSLNSVSRLHKPITSNIAVTSSIASTVNVTARLKGLVASTNSHSLAYMKVTSYMTYSNSSCYTTSYDGIIKERSLLVGNKLITVEPYSNSMVVSAINNTMVVT